MAKERMISVELTDWQWEMVRLVIEEDQDRVRKESAQAHFDEMLFDREGNKGRAAIRRKDAERMEKDLMDMSLVWVEITHQCGFDERWA